MSTRTSHNKSTTSDSKNMNKISRSQNNNDKISHWSYLPYPWSTIDLHDQLY